MRDSDGGGTHLPGGRLLHRQVVGVHDPLAVSLPVGCCLVTAWFPSALSPVPDYVKATVETVLKIHETEDDGDVLAFLTGQVGAAVTLFLKSGSTTAN